MYSVGRSVRQGGGCSGFVRVCVIWRGVRDMARGVVLGVRRDGRVEWPRSRQQERSAQLVRAFSRCVPGARPPSVGLERARSKRRVRTGWRRF